MAVLVVLSIMIGLLVGAVGAQPTVDRNVLRQLVITSEEFREALNKEIKKIEKVEKPLRGGESLEAKAPLETACAVLTTDKAAADYEIIKREENKDTVEARGTVEIGRPATAAVQAGKIVKVTARDDTTVMLSFLNRCPEDWRLCIPPQPLLREPSGSITAFTAFQNAADTDLLFFVFLYWFEELKKAEEFYKEPIALNFAGESAEDTKLFEGLSGLLKKELAVGEKNKGADEARLVGDPVERNPVLQFRKGQFVARFRVARISRSSTMEDFSGADMIKVAKKQLEKLVTFLKEG